MYLSSLSLPYVVGKNIVLVSYTVKADSAAARYGIRNIAPADGREGRLSLA